MNVGFTAVECRLSARSSDSPIAENVVALFTWIFRATPAVGYRPWAVLGISRLNVRNRR